MFRYLIAAFTALTLGACQTTTNAPEDTAAFIEAGIETQEFFADSIEGILTLCERFVRNGSRPSDSQLARQGYRRVDDPDLEAEVYAKPPAGADAISWREVPSIAFHAFGEATVRGCTLLTPPVAESRWLSIFVTKHFNDRGYTAVGEQRRGGELILRKGSRFLILSGARDRRGMSLTRIISISDADAARVIAAMQ